MSEKHLTRAWSISQGRPHRIERRHTGKELVVAQMADPFLVADSLVPQAPVTSGSWTATVQHLDPRFKLVATPFFRRSAWFAKRLRDGNIVGAEILNDTDGKNYTRKDAASILLRKDSATGELHEIGQNQSDTWLNGGTVPDGTEVSSATAGIRIKIDFAIEPVTLVHGEGGYFVQVPGGMPLTYDKLTTYDLVCGLEVVPDIRLGCDGFADEVLEALDITIDPPTTLTAGNQWLYEE